MRVGEDHSLAGQAISAGGGNLTRLWREAVDVPIAKVIAYNEDDVGARGGRGMERESGYQQPESGNDETAQIHRENVAIPGERGKGGVPISPLMK